QDLLQGLTLPIFTILPPVVPVTLPLMQKFKRLHEEMVNRILNGDGVSSQTQRRAAFDNTNLNGPVKVLVDKVANCSFKITERDIAGVRSSGLSEDAIFELVVSAAVGQATKQYEQALMALDEAAFNRRQSE